MRKLESSWPSTDAAKAALSSAHRAKRARVGKVGRSYSKLGEFTPRIWGPSEGARDAREHGAERIASPGKAAIVAFPAPRSPDAGERIQAGVVLRREGATLLVWRTLEDRSILIDSNAPVCTVGAGASREAIASIAATMVEPTIRYGHDGLIDYTVRKYKDHDSISTVRKVTVLQRTHRVATPF